MTRRELLELIAVLAALPACKDKRAPPPAPPATALDPAARRTLEAAVARILPADGDFPGARETGVIDFIDRQLAIEPLARIAPLVIGFARALGDFAALAPAAQDTVLEAASRGQLGSKLPEADLFRVLHTLVLEGFLSHPVHGGNRDQRAWRAIGFREPMLATR